MNRTTKLTLVVALAALCSMFPFACAAPPPTSSDTMVAELAATKPGDYHPIFQGAAGMADEALRLCEMHLPVGRVDGFAIAPPKPDGSPGWSNGSHCYDPALWLEEGYDGVHFIGQGMDETHIEQASWDSITIAVGQHDGVVKLSNLTVWGGHPHKGKAIQFGTPTHRILPGFRLHLENVRVAAHEPDEIGGARTCWLVFGYQADAVFVDCEFIGGPCNEHNIYWHGTAGRGVFHYNSHHRSAGAECFKVRSDTHETAWAGPNVAVVIDNSSFADWMQPWSWRGGAAIVLQGAAAHVLVQQSVFRPGPSTYQNTGADRSKTVMISAEGNSYDIDTGQIDRGYGNGYVLVRQCLAEASERGKPSYNELVNTGRWGGSQITAKAYLMLECGLWGEYMRVAIDGGGVPLWTIKGCNSARVTRIAREEGFDATHDAIYFRNGPTSVATDRLLRDN